MYFLCCVGADSAAGRCREEVYGNMTHVLFMKFCRFFDSVRTT